MFKMSWLRKFGTPPPASGATVKRSTVRPTLTSLEGRDMPAFGWASAIGGVQNEAVATDGNGDVYIMGSFNASFTPDGSSTPLTPVGSTDIFVAKYTRAGEFAWATSMGGSNIDNGFDITVSPAGNVFLSGRYSGSATFGSVVLASPSGFDGFAAKLTGSDGSVAWARNNLTVPNGRMTWARGIAADSADNAYVSGEFPFGLAAAQVALFKLDSTGATVWSSELIGSTSKKQPYTTSENPKIAVSGNGVYVTGMFAGNVDFDPGPGTATLTSPYMGGFVLKLSTSGTYNWAKTFAANNTGECFPKDIAVDGSGNVYTTGTFSGTIDFDPAADGKGGVGQYKLSPNSGGVYISKLDANGNFAWARNMAGTQSSAGGLAVDTTGVYFVGSFGGTADFNPGAATYSMISAGSKDAYVMKLNSSGAFQWAIQAGGVGNDFATSVAVNGFGEVYIAGSIAAGTSDFDFTRVYVDGRDLITASSQTGFLWQITQP